MANNETYTCSPSEVCLSDSDSEFLIPPPWSDESKNEKRAKRWREEFEWKRSLFEIDFTFAINAFDLDKGTDVMKDTVSLKNVYEEDVPLNNNIGKQSGDFLDIPSEAVEQMMDANVPDEIDGAKGEQVPNHVVKKEKGIKQCKRWYWNDLELENKWYITQLYEMHLFLNPSQREELENELTSQKELAVLQVEFADMEGQMQQLMEELKKSQK
ncbi:hypothetical protein Tco_1287341 [Tanacetum coccineum]